MLAKLSVDQALMKAKSNVRKGKLIEAKKLYEDIFKNYSKNKRAQQGLSDLNNFSRITTTQDPPQEIINQLLIFTNMVSSLLQLNKHKYLRNNIQIIL